MTYNTRKNKKMLLKTLGLAFLFFATGGQAYITHVDYLKHKETGHQVICLGDNHELPNDIGLGNGDIGRTEQTSIIKFAKKLHATIVLKPLFPEAYLLECFRKENENERKKRELFQEIVNIPDTDKIKSPLSYLYSHCVVNDINCVNVECRVSRTGFCEGKIRSQTLREKFERIRQIKKEIKQFNDGKMFKNIYTEELRCFSSLYLTLKRLVNNLGKLSDIPINQLITSIEDQTIILPTASSYVLANLNNNSNNSTYDPQAIAKNIKSLKTSLNIFTARFVDIYILHAIAQNKQKPIIVVASANHTKHVTQRLQKCGYIIKRSVKNESYFFYPSVLDLNKVLHDITLNSCKYYLQKIKSFFGHPWTKRIGYVTFAAAGIYTAAHWFSK